VIAAHRVGREGRVLALEPQRRVHQQLLANVALNRLENVIAMRVAASMREGELILHQVSAGNDGQATLALNPDERSSEDEAVPVQSLDRILADALPGRPPDLIKMDVEGAELDVLRSAPALFSTNPPSHLFIECIDRHLNRFGATSGMLVRWLLDAGYTVRGLRAGRWRQVAAVDGLSMDLLASR
jgi:FkbM family methyltransferase